MQDKARDGFIPLRREFLRRGVAGVAAASMYPSWSCFADVPGEKPRFSFVQLNDTHVQAPLGQKDDPKLKTYARANDKLQWAVGAINELKPDFVLGIGDLIHGERRERLELDLQTCKELLKPLQCPLYPAVGNHEVIQQEGNPDFERAYRAMYGEDRVNYTFEKEGLRFVVLNDSGATVVGAPVIKARNDWLRRTLAMHRDQPKILCCHIPIVPIRQEPVLAKSFRFGSYQAHDPELLEIVDSSVTSMLAVLSGHLHMTGYTRRKGVYHISISGTASYPSDFARFAVFRDRIEVQVQQLPKELAESHPSLHGKPRHAQDFTDIDHATGEAYKAGREDERRFSIKLPV